MFCLWPPARALEIDPIFKLQVLGGQYFYAGDKGALTGNASGLAAPALKFDERWALLPSVQSSYQGTKQVVDLVGSGTLFQEQMDHRASARAVYTPPGSRWRFKPSFSYKYEFLKETKGESWGSGLFDYRKWDIGAEAEFVYQDPFALRFGLDYYETDFPNYSSLESRAALEYGGQSLARELVGDRVLDTRSVMAHAAMDYPVGERFVLDGSLVMNHQSFPKQHVAEASGNLGVDLRSDVFASMTAAARMPRQFDQDLRGLAALELGFSYNTSNQNNYDAANVRYFPRYYNYEELRLAPSFKLMAGRSKRPVVVGLSGAWTHRRYPYRTAQDSSGAYSGGALRTDAWTAAASLDYPMAQRFSLMFDVQYCRAASNQGFEQFYRYNYTAANYLFGFSYEY